MSVTAKEVVDFWQDAGPERWFERSEAFDDMCEMGFEEAHQQAARHELDDWKNSAEGALALVILLDQIPRNIYRGSAQTYATDPLARDVAERAIERGFDTQVDPELRMFFYLPFMHSEDIADQQRSLALYRSLDTDGADKWAVHHHKIIERFGRFPHRNALLGRESTQEEQAYLDDEGFKG